MNKLIRAVSQAKMLSRESPFAIVSPQSQHWGQLFPVCETTLFVLLQGEKQLLLGNLDLTIQAGDFLLLPSSATANISDVIQINETSALMIWFAPNDFHRLHARIQPPSEHQYVAGPVDPTFERILVQFVEWAPSVPASMWPPRRLEILEYLQKVRHLNLPSLSSTQMISTAVYRLILKHLPDSYDGPDLCDALAVSESTLRRRLKAEGTSLRDIRDRARLGYGLSLIQTTSAYVAEVANRCGYQSQSRFTERFRRLFGVTPTELRRSQKCDRQR